MEPCIEVVSTNLVVCLLVMLLLAFVLFVVYRHSRKRCFSSMKILHPHKLGVGANAGRRILTNINEAFSAMLSLFSPTP